MTNNYPILRGPLRALFSSFLATGFALTAHAGSDGPELIWTQLSGSEGWLPRAVSIGNRGTQVFSKVGPFVDYTRLLSAHDANPPAPVWTLDESDWTFEHRVDSAGDRAVHVSLHKSYVSGQSGPKRPTVQKFTSSASVPDWEYTFATDHYGTEPADVAISRDGQRIVATAFDAAGGFKVRVVVFGAGSPVPQSNTLVDTHGAYTKVLLSADGNTLYFWANYTLTLFDVQNAEVIWSATVFDGPIQFGHAISGDGRTFAYGGANEVRIYRRNAQGDYVNVHEHALPAAFRCDALALSDDGSTLACGANKQDNLTVRIFAIELSGFQVTMSFQTSGSGTLANVVSGLAIAADGDNFVAGLWGDENQTVPEVFFFDSRQSVPLGSHDLPGSVLTVDLSKDGKSAVVASKETHANIFAGGGRISLFDARPVDFRMSGVPEPGSSVQFELHTQPHPAGALLIMSHALAATPTVFPGSGTLYLDRTDLTFLSMGNISNDGTARCVFQIDDSAMVGSSLYFQGLAAGPRRLSDDWVKLTVLP